MIAWTTDLCLPLFFRNVLVRNITLTVAAVACLNLMAQEIRPVTRLHRENSPYVRYSNQFLSGFMQTASADSLNGVLQMPYLGRPVWAYVGEKDSTQYMAYASGYRELAFNPLEQHCEVRLTRYGVKADLRQSGRVLVQHYAYPDTTAEKGFLIDLDHVLNGSADYDMDIKMVDHRTIRAYKRPYDQGKTGLYYYARFSRPYESYNIRREHVRLENGEREQRLKAAFTFLLAKDEDLVVTSAVSPQSADAAFALVEGHAPSSPFRDAAKPRRNEENLLASADERKNQPVRGVARQSASGAAKAKQPSVRPVRTVSNNAKLATTKKARQAATGMVECMEVETREASLRAAFYAALNHVMEQPQMKRVNDLPTFLQRLTGLALQCTENGGESVRMDSLQRDYASGCMQGESLRQDADGRRAAWFVLQSMGLSPLPVEGDSEHADYKLCRPLFNVVTLRYPGNRRFILHVKSNSPANCRVLSATWNGVSMPPKGTLTHAQLLRGGVLAVKMGK